MARLVVLDHLNALLRVRGRRRRLLDGVESVHTGHLLDGGLKILHVVAKDARTHPLPETTARVECQHRRIYSERHSALR